MSGLVYHANYGGATNAVHLIVHRGLDATITAPLVSVPRVLKHFVNSASKGGFAAIDAPPDINRDKAVERAPLTVDGLGRLEGLYDVVTPTLEYAVPSVFKSTGWVRRRLTSKEWLVLHDVPVAMLEELASDITARNALSLCITPLIVGELFRSWWGSPSGGVAGGVAVVSKSIEVTSGETGMGTRLDSARIAGDADHQEFVVREAAATPAAAQECGEDISAAANDQARLVVIKAQHDFAKAVKADDAEVPVHLWNDRICKRESSEGETRALNVLRSWFMRIYRRRLCRDCIQYLVRKHGAGWSKQSRAKVDGAAMKEIVWRAANNEWFEFPVGSRLHFFRFPDRYQALARDGVSTATSTGPHPGGHRDSPRKADKNDPTALPRQAYDQDSVSHPILCSSQGGGRLESRLPRRSEWSEQLRVGSALLPTISGIVIADSGSVHIYGRPRHRRNVLEF